MNGKTIVFVLLVLNLLVWLAAGWNDPLISAENGWLESFQAIALAAGAVIFAAAVCRAENIYSRFLYAGLTLFYVNFLLREINVRNLPLAPWAIYFLGGAGRNWALAILWAILFILFLSRRKEMTRMIFSWLRSAPGVFLLSAGAFYLSGLPFDKKVFGLSVERHEFFEEILEAQAALLMLVAAGFSFFKGRKHKTSFQENQDEIHLSK